MMEGVVSIKTDVTVVTGVWLESAVMVEMDSSVEIGD